MKLDDLPTIPFQNLPLNDTFAYPGSDRPRPKGTIRTHLSVWCGDCSEWLHVEEKTKSRAGVEAKAKGWACTQDRGWLCPSCFSRHHLGEQAPS